MGEGDALEMNIFNRVIQSPFDSDQRFGGRSEGCGAGHVFAFAWPVINFSVRQIFKPFTGLVQEFDGVGKIKGRLIFCADSDGGPGVLEFNGALGFFEGENGVGAFYFDGLDAQDGNFPHLVDDHFESGRIFHPGESGCGDGSEMIRFVPGNEMGEAAGVWFAGADGLVVVNPQLAEFQRAAIYYWDVGGPDFAISCSGKAGNFFGGFYPIGDGDGAAECWMGAGRGFDGQCGIG